MHWKQNECKHSVCCCLFDKSNKRERWETFLKNNHHLKKLIKNIPPCSPLWVYSRTVRTLSSLSKYPRPLRCAPTPGLCSRFVLAVFSTLLFLCRKAQLFSARRRERFFLLFFRKFGHHKKITKKAEQKKRVRRVDEKKLCPPLLRTTPLGYFGNQLWRHDFPRTKRRGFSRLCVFCGRRF